MDAIEILTADALAASLTAATFTGNITTITAVRGYTPDFQGEQLEAVQVTVVPGNVDVTPVTHGADLFEYEIHVMLAKRISANADIDDLVNLRTQIVDAIRSKALPSANPAMPTGAQWFSIANNVTYDRDTLMNQMVFLADIAVTYRRSQGKLS